MALIVAGISHHTAGVEIRERVALIGSELERSLDTARESGVVREAAALSTCNRTELYLVGDDPAVNGVAWSVLSDRLGADPSPHGYLRRERDAVSHLYRVTAGVDSMILGEAQIQGQVREAWDRSRAHSGPVLNRLFQSALHAGSRVRTETAIARGAASVGSAAVQLARKIFGSLAGRRAMVLGAGEMAELALQCLRAEGVKAALVANRTFARAEQLAALHGAEALHYDACWERIAEVDVLICSTASPHTVVSADRLRASLTPRGDRPLCILDIAMPRDVEPAARELGSVFLYDLDDLSSVVASSLEQRRAELPAAEAIVAAEVEQFWSWVAGLAAVPALSAFRAQMDAVRERELANTLRRLGHLPEGDRAAIEHFSRALMNKFLHEPSVRLRAAAANGHGLAAVDTLRYLFALEQAAADARAQDESELMEER